MTGLMGIRARQVRALIVPLLRVVRWHPVVVMAGLCAGLSALLQSKDEMNAFMFLRVVAVLLCMAVAFHLDDPAASLTAAVPLTLRARRVLRMTMGAVLVGVCWFALATQAVGFDAATGRDAPGAEPFPIARLTLELLVWFTVSLAAAAFIARRYGDDRGGIGAAPAMLFLVWFAARLPDRYIVLASPGSDRWAEAGKHLSIMLLGALIMLWFIHRDPAARSLVRSWPRRDTDVPLVDAPPRSTAAVGDAQHQAAGQGGHL